MIACALSACGGGAAASTETTTTTTTTADPEPTTQGSETSSDVAAAPPAEPAPRMRVVHATSDEAAASVSITLDGRSAVVDALAYGHASPYVDVATGRHSIVVHGPATEGGEGPSLALASDELESAHAYTVFFVTQGSADAPFALYTGDDDDEPGDDVAALRFFNAIIGGDDVDVCLPGGSARAPGEPVFADVAPNALGSANGLRYADLPAGAEVALQVRAHGSPPCRGRMIGIGRFTPTAGTSYTAVAIGRTSGRPRAELQLMVCSDAPADGSCQTVALASH